MYNTDTEGGKTTPDERLFVISSQVGRLSKDSAGFITTTRAKETKLGEKYVAVIATQRMITASDPEGQELASLVLLTKDEMRIGEFLGSKPEVYKNTLANHPDRTKKCDTPEDEFMEIVSVEGTDVITVKVKTRGGKEKDVSLTETRKAY